MLNHWLACRLCMLPFLVFSYSISSLCGMFRLLMFQKSISFRLAIACDNQKLYCSIILSSHSLFLYSLFIMMHCFSSVREVMLARCRSMSLLSMQQEAQLQYWMLMEAMTSLICSMDSRFTFWGMIQSVKKRRSYFLQIYISSGQQQYSEIQSRCLKCLRLLANSQRGTITLPNWKQLRNILVRMRSSPFGQLSGQCREKTQLVGWLRKYSKNALLEVSLALLILYPTVQKQWLSSFLSLASDSSTSQNCCSVTQKTSSQKLTCSSSTLSGVNIFTKFCFPSLSQQIQMVSRLMGRLKQMKSLTYDPSNPEKQKRVLFLMQTPGFLLPLGFQPLISMGLHLLVSRSISTRFWRSLLFCLPPNTYALLPLLSEMCPQRTISSRDYSYTSFHCSSFMSPVDRNSEKSREKLSSRQSYLPEHPPMTQRPLLQTKDEANFLAVGFGAFFCSFSSFH